MPATNAATHGTTDNAPHDTAVARPNARTDARTCACADGMYRQVREPGGKAMCRLRESVRLDRRAEVDEPWRWL